MFHLARYVGSGTEDDPFRPSGADLTEGWSAIDLRPDSTVADGFALLHSPEPLATSTHRVKLTDDPNDASTGLRDRLANKLGVNLDTDHFRRLVLSLLLEHGDDDNPHRWNRLRPAGDRFEVWLDGLLHTMPLVAGGATITDDFNRADSTNLGANWTESTGDADILSNQLRMVTAGTCLIRYTGASFATNDNYTQVDLAAISTNGSPGPYCRGQSSTTYYLFDRKFSTGAWQLWKVVSGAFTTLGSDIVEAFTPPGTMYVSAVGSTITSKVGGTTKHAVTDTAIATGTGLGLRDGNGGGNSKLDNFQADDTTAPASSGAYRMFAVF